MLFLWSPAETSTRILRRKCGVWGSCVEKESPKKEKESEPWRKSRQEDALYKGHVSGILKNSCIFQRTFMCLGVETVPFCCYRVMQILSMPWRKFKLPAWVWLILLWIKIFILIEVCVEWFITYCTFSQFHSHSLQQSRTCQLQVARLGSYWEIFVHL